MPGRKYADKLTLGTTLDVGDHLTAPQRFVFRPGGVAEGNVYTDFAALIVAMEAATTAGGIKEIVFDNSANGGANIVVPVAAYDFTDVRLTNGKKGYSGVVNFTKSGSIPNISAEIQVRVNFGDGATIITGGRLDLENVNLQFIGETPLITTSGDLTIALQNSSLWHDYYFEGAMIAVTSGDDLNIQMVDSLIVSLSDPSEGVPTINYLGGGGSKLTLVATGHGFINSSAFSSVGVISAREVNSSFGPDVTFQSQPSLDYVSTIRSPGVQGGRPTLAEQTVLTSAQLGTSAGGGAIQIRQAGLFWLANSAQPSVGNTLAITDGTTLETYTFVAGVPAAFEIEIGVTSTETHENTAASINANSLLWSAVVSVNLYRLMNKITSDDGIGVIVYRSSQLRENFPDRLFGTFTTGSPRTADFSKTLSYGALDNPGGDALPSADPGDQTFGYGAIGYMPDGRLAYALSERQLFANRNAANEGAEWYPIVPHGVEAFDESVGGPLVGTIDSFTALTTVLLAGATDLALTLPTKTVTLNTPVPTMIYTVKRLDADGTSSLTLASLDLIDGAGTQTVPISSALMLIHDGTTWHRVGSF